MCIFKSEYKLFGYKMVFDQGVLFDLKSVAIRFNAKGNFLEGFNQ